MADLTRESSSMTKGVVRGPLLALIARTTKANGKTGGKMEKVGSLMKMGRGKIVLTMRKKYLWKNGEKVRELVST